MTLFDTKLTGRRWLRVGDTYEVTKKPRGLDVSSLAAIPFASMASIPQGGQYAPDYIFKAPDEIRSGTYFEHGDILIAKITPCFENGKQALSHELPTPFGFATTEVIPLRPRDDTQDRRLLFFYLLHPDVRHYVAEHMVGTTGRRRVSAELILDLPFPEFEPEEQTAIANSLELIQQLMFTDTKSIQMGVALKRTVMHSLFTRGLFGEVQKETELGRLPVSWNWLPILSLGKIVTGNTPPTKDSASYAAGNVPFITPGDIEHGFKVGKTERLITEQGLERSRPISKGATCFVCIGSSIGKVGYTTFAISATNQQINSILPNDRFVPLFTFYLLTFWADHVRKHASQSPVPILSKSAFEQIGVVATTDLEEQKEIVAILDVIDQKIDLHRKKRAMLDDLFRTLLHKLMTGKIRVTDLNLSSSSGPCALAVSQKS